MPNSVLLLHIICSDSFPRWLNSWSWYWISSASTLLFRSDIMGPSRFLITSPFGFKHQMAKWFNLVLAQYLHLLPCRRTGVSGWVWTNWDEIWRGIGGGFGGKMGVSWITVRLYPNYSENMSLETFRVSRLSATKVTGDVSKELIEWCTTDQNRRNVDCLVKIDPYYLSILMPVCFLNFYDCNHIYRDIVVPSQLTCPELTTLTTT